MNRIVCFAASWLLVFVGTSDAQEKKYTPWKLYNKGVKWEKTLSTAQAKAKKERKLILYYLNTGDIHTFETS